MNENTVTIASMQADHRTWLAAHDQWRQDIDRWQAEHESAVACLAAMQESVRKHGEAQFAGKALCAVCHPAPYYTDNLMHNLRVERFFEERMINGRKASADGPIRTFPLRGIKNSPPYLHDGRLLTLEDTVEFFNIVSETRLTAEEKADLVAFLHCL